MRFDAVCGCQAEAKEAAVEVEEAALANSIKNRKLFC